MPGRPFTDFDRERMCICCRVKGEGKYLKTSRTTQAFFCNRCIKSENLVEEDFSNENIKGRIK